MSDALGQKTYLPSPIGHPRSTEILVGSSGETSVTPESAGAQSEGTLPKIRVLS